MLNILLFAGLAESVGASSVRLEVEFPSKVGDVKRTFAASFPAAEALLESCFAAVNQTYAGDETFIQEGDEVAFIPPVSGG